MLWTMYIGVLIMGVGRTNFDVITRQTVKVHRDRIFSGYGPRNLPSASLPFCRTFINTCVSIKLLILGTCGNQERVQFLVEHGAAKIE